jgi:hypothetical protein
MPLLFASLVCWNIPNKYTTTTSWKLFFDLQFHSEGQRLVFFSTCAISEVVVTIKRKPDLFAVTLLKKVYMHILHIFLVPLDNNSVRYFMGEKRRLNYNFVQESFVETS